MSDCATTPEDKTTNMNSQRAQNTVNPKSDGALGRFSNLFAPSEIAASLRAVLLFVGMAVMSVGIDVIVAAGLGNSPISSCPYVATLAFPAVSFGTFLIIWHAILIAAQIVLLRRDFRLVDWLQVPMTFYFGVTTDLFRIPLAGLTCSNYVESLLVLALGICVLAFGVALVVVSNTVMNCGEALVRAISITFHKKFGNVKVFVDLSFVVCAAVLSVALLGHLDGVREGSIICAATTGLVVNVLVPKITAASKRLVPAKRKA